MVPFRTHLLLAILVIIHSWGRPAVSATLFHRHLPKNNSRGWDMFSTHRDVAGKPATTFFVACCVIAAGRPIECKADGTAVASDGTAQLICGDMKLSNFEMQGSGGTGRLLSAKSATGKVLATKFSWPTTRESVRHECDVLRYLESYHVPGVEKCLANCATTEAFVGGGSNAEVEAAVFDPFFNPTSPSTAVLSDDRLSHSAKSTAVHGLATTVVQMLLAGVASSDFQPLIDPSTGQTLLIDLSEAVIFTDRRQPTTGELQIAQNFLSEFVALVASASTSEEDVEMLLREAKDVAQQQLRAAEANDKDSESALVALIDAILDQ